MDNPFYQGLTNEDVQVRVETVRGLASFAEQIGHQRTREELLPALSDICLLDDEDEVLLPLAEELGKFLPLVGGENHIVQVLSLLEALSKSEESRVCTKATNSLSMIGSGLSDGLFRDQFLTLVIRLAEEEWYPPKASSCPLFPEALSRADPTTKDKLLSLYVTLCKDKTPMVRRAAASNLKKIFPLILPDQILVYFVEVYKLLAADTQDSVRLLVIEVAAALALRLRESGRAEEGLELVKPVVLSCAADKSWRVRYMVASCFESLAQGLGADVTRDILYVFEKLLRDGEAEVRTAAAGKISGVSALLDLNQVITSLLPCVSVLVTDHSQQVRSALASDILLLAPFFGSEGTSQHLLSIFLQLLKDDVPDVRLNIISKLDQVTKVIGLDKLSEHLIPAIVHLAEDKQWRIRMSVIKYIPPLARQLSEEFFNAKLSSLCFSWLTDSVSAIRKAAVENIKELTIVFGDDFTTSKVLPQIRELTTRKNYLHRMTVVLFVSSVGEIISISHVVNFLLPLALGLAQDPVPNIRFAAVAALLTLTGRLDEECKGQIRNVLQSLSTSDSDVAVKASAEAALCNL